LRRDDKEREDREKASKLKLRYMVVPQELRDNAYVEDPVKIKILNSDELVEMGVLGESGKKLVDAGIPFYFERTDAVELIEKGLAKKV